VLPTILALRAINFANFLIIQQIMTITLNIKKYKFPEIVNHSNLLIDKAQIPNNIKWFVIKNINRNTGWLIIDFFSENGFDKTFYEITEEKKIAIEPQWKYFEISLSPNSVNKDDEFAFDLEFI